jgi:phage tail-like protein
VTAVPTPAVASRRAYMRSQLPGVFQAGRDPLAPALIEGLEEVLDPIVAVIDGLPSYLDPALAPPGALALLAVWVGVRPQDGWTEDRRRDAVAGAATASRRRGTRAGVEHALAGAFPSLPLRVEESGAVRWRADELGQPVSRPTVTVVCDTPIERDEQRAIVALLREELSAGVRIELLVRERRQGGRAP